MQAWPDVFAVQSYWLDTWQRSILFLDVLRERGNNYLEHSAKDVPHVLSFEAELVRDGRTLERPVNYALVRIVPPAGTRIDPTKAPIHRRRPARRPRPRHRRHEARQRDRRGARRRSSLLLRRASCRSRCPARRSRTSAAPRRLHRGRWRRAIRMPKASRCVIGNCQAGWQIMMMAAISPDLPGPIMLAGSPLSYWAGVRGKQSAALSRRPARRHLADGTRRRSRQRHLRRRQSGRQFRVAATRPTPIGTRPTTSIRRSTPRSAPLPRLRDDGGAARCCSTPTKCSTIADELFVGNRVSTGQICSLRRGSGSICATSGRRSSCSAPGATTSRRRSRRCDWIIDLYEHEREISRTARRSSTACTRASVISAFSCPARWPARSTASSRAQWT